MPGYKIVNPGSVRYANATGSAGKTSGLLTTFTHTSSATPSAGNIMSWDTSTTDYAFKINSGLYTGTYTINRNDIPGEDVWKNAISNPNQMSLDLFHDYQHWTSDQRFGFIVSHQHPDDHFITINITGGADVVKYASLGSSGLYDPFSGNIDFYSAGPGSSGAFDAGGVNTGWSIQFSITNVSATMPSNVNIAVIDFHTHTNIYNNNTPLFPGNSWTFSDSWNQRYYSAFDFRMDIN